MFIDSGDLRRFLGVPSGPDEDLDLVAVTACDLAEQWVGPVTLVAVTDTIDTSSPSVALSKAPVASLTAVSSGVVGDYTTDSESGILRSVSGAPLGSLVVTYQAGYVVPPKWAVTAALIIGQHLWRTRRGAGGQRGVSDDAQIVGVGYAIPNQAAAILEPHRRIGLV